MDEILENKVDHVKGMKMFNLPLSFLVKRYNRWQMKGH